MLRMVVRLTVQSWLSVRGSPEQMALQSHRCMCDGALESRRSIYVCFGASVVTF